MATRSFTIGTNRLLRLAAQFATRPFRPDCPFPTMSSTPPAHGKYRSRAREGTESQDRLRSLLRQFSHDLRSPLNAILGFADLLAQPGPKGVSDRRGLEYARFIKASGEQLLATFTPLLHLARLEVGDVELDLQPLSVTERVRALVERRPGPQPGLFVEDPKAEILADEASLTVILALVLSPRPDPESLGIQILVRKRHLALLVVRSGGAPRPERLDHILAERLCRAMGGRLRWRHSPGQEACIIILPRAGCTEPQGPLSRP